MEQQQFIETYIPKKYRESIEDIEMPYEGGEGYWIYLKDGYTNSNQNHTVHEYTIKDLQRAVRTIEREEQLND